MLLFDDAWAEKLKKKSNVVRMRRNNYLSIDNFYLLTLFFTLWVIFGEGAVVLMVHLALKA